VEHDRPQLGHVGEPRGVAPGKLVRGRALVLRDEHQRDGGGRERRHEDGYEEDGAA
jgi:hypothetical protein